MLGYQTVEELMEDDSKNSNIFYGDGKAENVKIYHLTRKGRLAIKEGKKASELTVKNRELILVEEKSLEQIAFERKLNGSNDLDNIINTVVIKNLISGNYSENEREKEEAKKASKIIAQQIAEDKKLIEGIIKKYGFKPQRRING